MLIQNYKVMVRIIVHYKAPLHEMLKDFNEVVHWNIKEQKNILIAVIHKKIFIRFIIKVFLKNQKCRL